jgi:hypothetical protein
MIPYQSAVEESDELERREASTRESVLKVQDWKREMYKKKFEENKNESTEN